MTALHFWAISKAKWLLIGIQNLNAQYISVEYFEQANWRLEDAILTLQLLLQSKDSVLRDFETIIEDFDKSKLCFSCNDKV